MAELKKPKEVPNPLVAHVVFVHGLNGDNETTWQSSGKTPEFWPNWLQKDVAGVAIWSLGYPAASSKWRKNAKAMALPDRAKNILPVLLDDASLQSGPIFFIGYSLGGLVIKETLRLAETKAPHDVKAAEFLRRVGKIILLGTPNLGSDHASLLSKIPFISRPLETISGLGRNDPHLMNLNDWFRGFVPKNKVDVLVLTESRRVGFFGYIVKPDSADPGLPIESAVVPVDEDHISICHPISRDAEVYQRIAAFIAKPFVSSHADTLLADNIRDVSDKIEAIQTEFREAANTITNTVVSGAVGVNNPVVTTEAQRQLLTIRQIRHISGFDPQKQCNMLLYAVEKGELAVASNCTRRQIFSWCSRILSAVDIQAAKNALSKADILGNGEENIIAEAFILYFEQRDKPNALARLAELRTPMARSASFIVVANGTSSDAPLKWLADAGLTINDLDVDGKLQVIHRCIMLGNWSQALLDVEGLSEKDFEDGPLLLCSAARTYLAQAIHPEFRAAILGDLPMDMQDFKLGMDSAAMEFRTKAKMLYERSSTALANLAQDNASGIDADYAIWLSLLDPALFETARNELEASMGVAKIRLRRIPMALAFGLDLDTRIAEKEIDRETTLSSGRSHEAARARFAIATATKTPHDAAQYIAHHRDQLITYYKPDFVDSIQIEALAKSGQIAEARLALAQLQSRGEHVIGLETLTSIIDEADGANPIALLEAQYKSTGKMTDLNVLMEQLKRKNAFSKLVIYGKRHFEQTKDVASAEVYANALYEEGGDNEVIELATKYPEIINQSAELSSVLAWAYYRQGDFTKAQHCLARLRKERDSPNDRYLFVNVAIASGEWSSLGAFVESEWQHKNDREPLELLRAGILAQRTGLASRSQELIRIAAKQAKGNAKILLGCYSAASSSGWENESEVHEWLVEAEASSDENGPVQKIRLEEFVKMQPGKNKQTSRVWELLLSATVPTFTAAKALNQTLLDLYLRPALLNLGQSDPRKRGLIFAFSGAQPVISFSGKRLCLDVTAILNLALTDLLQKTIDWSDQIVIAHTTLGWLFEERERLAFHQPSQVREAFAIKRLLDQGLIHRFDGATPPLNIEQEVGDEIARFLVAATTLDDSDLSQKIVVAPYPIAKSGTLMNELANTSLHDVYFAGCGELISALRRLGSLTSSEEENARTYLKLQEEQWPHKPTIQENATLYLDAVTVSHLLHLRLLDRLSSSGFNVFIASSIVDNSDELVQHESTSEKASDIVENVRNLLANGIASGKVKLIPIVKNSTYVSDDDESYLFEQHPSMALFADTSEVDVLVIDDRFHNQHREIETNDGNLLIANSIDLVEKLYSESKITRSNVVDVYTKFRQSGFVFVPHRRGEINDFLDDSQVIDGKVLETAELRAVRESILRARMTDALQFPNEHVWMDQLLKELISSLRSQWNDQVLDSVARTRSSWLLNQIDVRGWAHRTNEHSNETADRYQAQILMLLMLPDANISDRERYWQWLEDIVLSQFKEENPKSYQEMVASIEDHLARAVNRTFPGKKDE